MWVFFQSLLKTSLSKVEATLASLLLIDLFKIKLVLQTAYRTNSLVKADIFCSAGLIPCSMAPI